MTELQELRKFKEEAQLKIEQLEEKVDELEYQVDEKSQTILLMDSELSHNKSLDTSTLDKLMMYELLNENWDALSISEIQAICK